jgi:hypothetical protein
MDNAVFTAIRIKTIRFAGICHDGHSLRDLTPLPPSPIGEEGEDFLYSSPLALWERGQGERSLLL